MKYRVTIAGQTRPVEILRVEGRIVVHLDGKPIEAELTEIQPGRYSLRLEGRQFDLTLLRESGATSVYQGPRLHKAELQDARLPETRGVQGRSKRPFELRSVMPGKVSRILVQEGQQVGPEDGVVVVEAMKMENELRAGQEARVQAILVKPGQLVDSGAPLVRFGPVEA